MERFVDGDDYREVAKRSVELQLAATVQALEEAEAKKLKDPGKTAQNAAVAGGVAVDKILTLTGRPDSIVGHLRDPSETLKALALKVGLAVDSTAEEIVDTNNRTSESAELPLLQGKRP